MNVIHREEEMNVKMIGGNECKTLIQWYCIGLPNIKKSAHHTVHGRNWPTLQKIVEIVQSYNTWYGSAHPTEIGTNPPILQHMEGIGPPYRNWNKSSNPTTPVMYNPVIQVVGIGRHCTVHTVHVLYILNGNINTVHRKQIWSIDTVRGYMSIYTISSEKRNKWRI